MFAGKWNIKWEHLICVHISTFQPSISVMVVTPGGPNQLKGNKGEMEKSKPQLINNIK